MFGLPAELHRQTLYDWGRRGLRTYHGFRFKGATGRPRCTFDPAWRHQFDAIPARSGQTRLLRRISSQTTEWVAVARRRGQFWVVAYYLVPRMLASSLTPLQVDAGLSRDIEHPSAI
jgi:hypothetical protein